MDKISYFPSINFEMTTYSIINMLFYQNKNSWTDEKCLSLNIFWCKVEKILKGSLDLIPSTSPSVKIQIMGWKVCLRGKGKTLLGKLLHSKVCWHNPEMFCFYIFPPLKVTVIRSNPGYHLKYFLLYLGPKCLNRKIKTSIVFSDLNLVGNFLVNI